MFGAKGGIYFFNNSTILCFINNPFSGTDFRKLKAPFILYDLLYVLEVLSRFPWVRTDGRFLDMLGLLQGKADADGSFTL